MTDNFSFVKRNLADQVADEISTKITSGYWKSQLPSIRQLAGDHGVSTKTAQQAVQLLAQRKVIDLKPRMGAFIRNQKSGPSSRARQIAVITGVEDPDLTSPVHSNTMFFSVLMAAKMEFLKSDYQITLLPYIFDDPNSIKKLETQIADQREILAGAIYFCKPGDEGPLTILEKNKIPYITINLPDRRSTYNFVTSDTLYGALQLGRCLIKMGLTRVTILNSDAPPSSAIIERILGLYHAYLEACLPVNQIEIINAPLLDEKVGRDVTRKYLQGCSRPPQVIFAMGDWLASGALRVCKELGLKIPQDIAVIGSTGVELAALTDPPLTVLAMPMVEMGRQAAKMLIKMLNTGITHLLGQRIPCPLIIRESFVPPDSIRQAMQEDYNNKMKEFDNLILPNRE